MLLDERESANRPADDPAAASAGAATAPVQRPAEPAPPATPTKKRIALNVLIAAAILFAIGWSTLQHLRGVEQTWSIAVLAGLQVLLWVLRKLSEEHFPTFFWKLVTHPDGTVILLFTLVAILFVVGVTSSIQIVYQGPAGTTQRYRVRVEPHSFVGREFTVSADKKIDREFLFFRTTPVELKLAIVEPQGFVPFKPRTLRAGRAIRVEVPGERKTYRLLRIVPGAHIDAPLADRPMSEPLWLRVTAGGKTYELKDVRLQPILIGSSADEMKEIVTQSDAQGRAEVEYRQYLDACDLTEGDDRNRYLRGWRSAPEYLASGELTAGQTIRIEYGRGAETRINRFLKIGTSPIETVFLEEALSGGNGFVVSSSRTRRE